MLSATGSACEIFESNRSNCSSHFSLKKCNESQIAAYYAWKLWTVHATRIIVSMHISHLTSHIAHRTHLSSIFTDARCASPNGVRTINKYPALTHCNTFSCVGLLHWHNIGNIIKPFKWKTNCGLRFYG